MDDLDDYGEKRILVDSSFLIALFRKNDSLHSKALENRDLLNNSCFVTNLVLNEVITVLAMRTKDINLVKSIYDYIMDNFIILKEYSMHNFNNNVFSLFADFNSEKYALSFTDVSLVYLADVHGFKLLTLDEGFKKVDNINLLL